MSTPRTLFEKIWQRHVILEREDGAVLLHVARHLVHDGSAAGFRTLRDRGLPLRRPDRTFGTPDHYVPTTTRDMSTITEAGRRDMVSDLARNSREYGFTVFGLDDPRQGIIHVIGPEQGITQPGLLMVCGDSHTATHGAFGALAFGIGASEVAHVLATQTLWQAKPRSMRVNVTGQLGPGVTAKDVIIAIIAQISAAGGTGHVIEYAGPVIRALSMEGRLTLCNMSIEAGARAGMVAPDEVTYAYLKGRPYVPSGGALDQALAFWRSLPSDEGAVFDTDVTVDGSAIAPMLTWGTSPESAGPITGSVPDPAAEADEERQGVDAAGAGLHGADAGCQVYRYSGRSGFHWVLHQQPDRGLARRRGGGEGAQGLNVGDGGAWLWAGEGSGGGGGAGSDLPGGRAGVAACRLFDVRGDERRSGRGRGAVCLDLQP